MLPDADAVAIVYNFTRVCEEFDFSVRPFAAMRDFHSLRKSDSPILAKWRDDGLAITTDSQDSGELFMPFIPAFRHIG